jgi:hypothetical protein
LFPVVGDLEVSGSYDRLGNGYEHEPTPSDIPVPTLPNAGRPVLVSTSKACARVDVDGLKFPDPVTVGSTA